MNRLAQQLLPLVVTMLVALPVEARVVVRHASELEMGRKMGGIGREYQALSAANIIFEKCEADYPTIAQDKAFLAERWPKAYQAYVDAYHEEYVSRVGYPPGQDMVNEYVARIRAVQQNAVNNADASIRETGCRTFSIQPVVDYIHQLHVAVTKQPQGSTP